MASCCIVVMGVSGSGKSTLAKDLYSYFETQRKLSPRIIEGDDYHSAESIAKMRSGQPLTDSDRWPWLQRIRDAIIDGSSSSLPSESAQESITNITVVACSCLRRVYRDYFRHQLKTASIRLLFVYLHVPPDDSISFKLLEDRLNNRGNHFMPSSLISSQLAALEDPRQDSAEGEDVYYLPFDYRNEFPAIAERL